MSKSPYRGLKKREIWRTAVEKRKAFSDTEMFQPRFPLTAETRVATAGSCFAQHVGKSLRSAGLKVLDVEPSPIGTDSTLAKDFGYQTYSARYGNIYTSAQLLQLLKEALGRFKPAEPVWALRDRYVDSQRPSVEPTGLDTPEQVILHRKKHLNCVLEMMKSCDVFIFTFGLTEAWLEKETNTVFPLAPGTLAGTFDPDKHVFKNFRVHEVVASFNEFIQLARSLNPNIKFLITVSPIPLAATASGEHIEVATSKSKAVLRAACDELASEHEYVDYFPSYEIITSQWAKGQFYQPNLRDVTPKGVSTVMNVLLRSYGLAQDQEEVLAPSQSAPAKEDYEDDVRCEEILLDSLANNTTD